MSRPRVVVLRGHSANPWELGAWEPLAERFDVRVAVTGSNRYDVGAVELAGLRARAVRDVFPRGRVGDALTLLVGDRYRGLEDVLRGAAIVHSAELGVWFSGQPARLKAALGFKLVLTVWETIPFRETFRAFRGRADRRAALAATDLFLAATERARTALLLEGVPPERVEVAPPGIDVERFRGAAGEPERAPRGHLVVSAGRLVWEKGHYDVLRAVALLEERPRVLIVGEGPERERLERYAAELGLAALVEIRPASYAEMPEVFAAASAVVLASLPIRFWEEQFGMVLAEAMAAGAPIVASSSGAIPEVLGPDAVLFAPGDWVGLSRLLRDGPLSRPGGGRVAYDAALVERYSNRAAAERLAAAYERVLYTRASSSR